MDTKELNTFPKNEREALALLYVQTRDLSNATPENLLEIYHDAYNRIDEAYCKS